jgi:hypothetical protein
MPSPMVDLNRAVAHSMAFGPEAGRETAELSQNVAQKIMISVACALLRGSIINETWPVHGAGALQPAAGLGQPLFRPGVAKGSGSTTARLYDPDGNEASAHPIP